MRRRNGFTLIELLVVIAIIAILAAIIFPVYAQAKKSAYKSSDLSNMNSLRTALQLYRADAGAFPPALLGYISPYENSNGGTNIVPPGAIKAALYPKRVESLSVFRPSLLRVPDNAAGHAYNEAAINAGTDTMVTAAYWPGSGSGNAGQAGQRYGSNVVVNRAYHDPITNACTALPAYYYKLSGYDAAPAGSDVNGKWETHYQLFWTGWTVPADPCSPDGSTESGNAGDDVRQLGYTDPPETTVVTWNGFFRDYVNGAPQHIKQDLVLFLAGNARPMDSAYVASEAWKVKP
jgi:prepilin-type N-terminal cleavage/methylation domain-containing protein